MKHWWSILVCMGLIGGVLMAQSTDEAANQAEQAAAFSDAPLDMSPYMGETREPGFRLNLDRDLLRLRNEARVASARIAVDFSERDDSPLSVEFEGKVSELPLVVAFYEQHLCDTELEHEVYRERGHEVQLGFQVKTRPMVDEGIPLVIEHWHLPNAEENTFVASYNIDDVLAFTPMSVLLPNALPGMNRYILRVPSIDGIEEAQPGQVLENVAARGVSHFIMVHEVAAMGATTEAKFAPEPTCRMLGGRYAWQTEMQISHTFTLNPALAPEDVSIRLMRRGFRKAQTEHLPLSVRELIGEPEDTAGAYRGAQEAKLEDSETTLMRVEDLGNHRFRATYRHAISASQRVLPLEDIWDYRLEIWHERHASPVDVLRFSLDAIIRSPSDASITYAHSGNIEVTKAFAPVGFDPASIAPEGEEQPAQPSEQSAEEDSESNTENDASSANEGS